MKSEIKKEIVLELVDEHPRDMSIGELSKATGRSRETISKYLKWLSTQNYVEESRKVGRARMFAVGSKLENFTGDGGEAVDAILQLVEE